MSIAPSTLLVLQQAGESLHAARNAFAQEVQSNASRVIGIVASEPFGNEADRAYTQLRSIARMAHELQALEEQLKTMYEAAGQLMVPETPVLVALSDRGTRTHAHQSTSGTEGIEDVVAKAVPQKPTRKTKAAAKATTDTATQTQRMSPNDQKVLAHLKQILDRRRWKTFTQAAIAQGAGIPLGSVGLAIRRVVTAGAVREGDKGSYRLA